MNIPAHLILADGLVFTGTSFGAETEMEGEVVFNTSMTGYPELLTDPSYHRQILVLTYPEIGNYGVSLSDVESTKIQAAGLVVRALSSASNWRSNVELPNWLASAGVPGIFGIDTRALVRHLRDAGSMMGLIHTGYNPDIKSLVERAAALPGMGGANLTPDITCKSVYTYTEGLLDDDGEPLSPLRPPERHVVVVDLGIKLSILRLLVHHGCRVSIVPSHTSYQDIIDLKPDGVFLSNGPGDPSTQVELVDTVRALLGKVPIFGICMGHQILAQALGATTYKTTFGHRGGNQPVINEDGRVWITSQNHGFAVDAAGLLPPGRATGTNVSDRTNEGVDVDEARAFSVQYHPEAAPGPHDARGCFEKFYLVMEIK